VIAETRLADDLARGQERARRAEALDALRRGAETWEGLARLIGSADGKKLRLVVQSMALDILLAHANQQLRVLAPRYRLARRATQPGSLALDVLDADLEGGPRATSSLSGGERFLVSLALALGLGTMTAEHDDVGSLFLDEGFGSLDEESLEQALDALDALRQAGRQIGVVSHVARLSERFEVRVEVRPTEPGASRVCVSAG
jgi:exonuclease SbcC